MSRLLTPIAFLLLAIQQTLALPSPAPAIKPRDATTAIVSVTLTTTVHATSTDSGTGGPCDNFYGACVVYGGQGSAAYTTTVYATGPAPTPTPTTPSTTYTRTTTYLATTTVTDGNACRNYDGACVVYATDGTAASTVYAGSAGPGNAGGFIGAAPSGDGTGGDNGVIGFGAAGRIDVRWAMGLAVGMVGVVGLFIV